MTERELAYTISELRRERDEARTQLAEARAALKPFARYAAEISADARATGLILYKGEAKISVADFARAVAARQEAK